MMQTENTVGIHVREPVEISQCHDMSVAWSRGRSRSLTMKGGCLRKGEHPLKHIVMWKVDNANHPWADNPHTGTVTCHSVLMDNENAWTSYFPTVFMFPGVPPSQDPDFYLLPRHHTLMTLSIHFSISNTFQNKIVLWTDTAITDAMQRQYTQQHSGRLPLPANEGLWTNRAEWL